jgi:LacI family transcriptional regulator
VPGQLSVVGCSDDACAQLTQPALTTLHLPAEEMGVLAVSEIDRLVREPLLAEPRKSILPVALIQRDSAGPAKKQ